MFDYVRQSNEIVVTENFRKFGYRTHDYESVFSLLHPRMFLPRLSSEYIVFTEFDEGRNATGMISLF